MSTPLSRFRPCIDLHDGQVKQIVGGSLRDQGSGPTTNFESQHDAAWYAERYQQDNCRGGHVIKLGPGNDEAARRALKAWPGGLQIGGGITADNALAWLESGASQVIVTSWLFDTEGRFLEDRLKQLSALVGPERLVVDLSCRRDPEGDGWIVAMNRWQTPTTLKLSEASLQQLSPFCGEFLIHAADVEGLCGGMDDELIQRLGEWTPCPITYAGGARSLEDLRRVHELSKGRVDLTIGSALDLFGGEGVRYSDCLDWNRGEPSDV